MADYTVTITITHAITAGNEEKAQERADLLAGAYGAATIPRGKWVGDAEVETEVEEA